jgi:hypothetical protein
MKSIAIAAAITLIATYAALAAPKRADHSKLENSRAMVVDTESYDVYVNGKLIGRDPDPAIRQRLRTDYHWLSGN